MWTDEIVSPYMLKSCLLEPNGISVIWNVLLLEIKSQGVRIVFEMKLREHSLTFTICHWLFMPICLYLWSPFSQYFSFFFLKVIQFNFFKFAMISQCHSIWNILFTIFIANITENTGIQAFHSIWNTGVPFIPFPVWILIFPWNHLKFTEIQIHAAKKQWQLGDIRRCCGTTVLNNTLCCQQSRVGRDKMRILRRH